MNNEAIFDAGTLGWRHHYNYSVAEVSPLPPQRRAHYVRTEATFGAKVRKWRKDRYWSQTVLSFHMKQHGFDLHQTSIAKLEKGVRPIRLAEVAALLDIFDKPWRELN